MAKNTLSNESSSLNSDKDKASAPLPSSDDSESPKSTPPKSPPPSPPLPPSPPKKSAPPPTESPPAPAHSSPPTPSQSPPPTPPHSPPPSPSPPTPPPEKSPPSPSNSPPPPSTPPPSKDSAPPPSPSEPPPSPPPSPPPPPPQNSPPSPQSLTPPPHSLSPPTAIPTPPSPASHVTPPPAPLGSGPNHPSPPRPPPSTQPKPRGTPPKSDPPSSSPSSGNNTGEIVGLALAGVFIIAFLALVIFFMFGRKQKRASVYAMPPPRKSHMKGGEEPGFGSGALGAMNLRTPSETTQHMNTGQLVFTYEKVAEITNGFASENIIGEGGFGYVYKASMPDGRVGALKLLKAGSGQGEREFRAEVDIISRIHHRHLVSLIGYCISEQQRVLIYEFVPNGNLSQHLHGSKWPILDWPKRMKIAIGSARGLAYLHDGCNPKIIHRDIKSANILLDNAYEAQVADFGLARLTDDANTHARPLLLRAVETGDFGKLVDPRLERQYVDSEMFRMIETAAACVRHSAPKRPRMVQVARSLDSGNQLYDLSNGVKYGQSTVYDSGQYNEDIEIFKRMVNGSFDDSEFDMNSMEYRSTVSREMSGSRHSRMPYSEGSDSDFRVFHGQRSNTQNMS
ncbi:hypothetical protein JHK87_000295 [Glycine soja]|nr:hypothetical protein JHK87_000295 [Glycine soja]